MPKRPRRTSLGSVLRGRLLFALLLTLCGAAGATPGLRAGLAGRDAPSALATPHGVDQRAAADHGTLVATRSGKPFTPKGKQDVVEENKSVHGGAITCDQRSGHGCGQAVVPAKKSVKGVKPPSHEAQIDHVEPKAHGGSGSPDNGQVLCRTCNRRKTDHHPCGHGHACPSGLKCGSDSLCH